MLIPFTTEWRVARERRQRASAFLSAMRREPIDADVDWLTDAAAAGDRDHALWELRYARLALALLTAQRDALDDRTVSDVVAALDDALVTDARVDSGMHEVAQKQLNDRLSAYREALSLRGGNIGSGERLGRVLLAFASAGARSAGAPLPRAIELMTSYITEANEALRTIYGAVALPDHLAPSEIAAS